jgi:nucleotide-binding universal stress UspA family protein
MYEVGPSRSPRVVVGVHGSLTSLAALRTALQEARDRGAVLMPVLAWSPVGGEFAYRRSPCPELLRVWRTDATERLATAFNEAFGGYPGEVDVQGQVVRATAGPTLVQAASEPGDLLVVGSGHRRVWSRRVHGPTARYCLARANCAVMLVPPPELLYHAKQKVA